MKSPCSYISFLHTRHRLPKTITASTCQYNLSSLNSDDLNKLNLIQAFRLRLRWRQFRDQVHGCVHTPWCKMVFQKADSHSACQTIACFIYGTRRFITMFTKARHWTLSWASRIQFAPSIPLSLRSILMLSSHLRLGLLSGLFPSGLPTETL
jgi:hypothetical protein